VRQVLEEKELDAILITRPENQRYLSGFTGGEGALLISEQDALILTDFRYFEQVAEEAPGFELVKVEGPAALTLKNTLKRLAIKLLGFESTHVSHALYQEWRKATRGTKWVATKDVAETIRMIKDDGELASIRRAVAIADDAVEHIRQFAQPGMTEKELAWEIELYMRTQGAEGIAFDLIVGSGPNGAKPHAVVSERMIVEGEPIVMDIGAKVEGYCSDLTRTICLGEADEKLRHVHEVVLQAQLAAEEQAKPGMTGKELDAIAREVIEEAGFAEHFGHGLGHGVGLAVHEMPRVNVRGTTPLEPGMVFTVEPGIYLPGWGGVRIEDLVCMTDQGATVLSSASKRVTAR
jgi:Xaa-Pro aminopeptidase